MSDISSSVHTPGSGRLSPPIEREIFEVAFRHVLTPLAILDGKFNFILVNEAFARICERPVHEYPGRNYFEFFPSTEYVNLFMEVLNAREPRQAWSKPTPLICMQGVVRSWDLSLAPIPGASGEVDYLILSVNDVTERDRARLESQSSYHELEFRVQQRTKELQESEESLKKSRDTLELALDAAELGTWDWDIRQDRLRLSRRCNDLFDLDSGPEADPGLHMEKIIPEDRERVRQAALDALERKRDYNVEMRVKTPDGSIRWLRSKGKGFYDENGAPVRMIGVTWEITEPGRIRDELRKQRDQLEAINKELESYTSIVSHDLRSPIRALEDYTKAILRDYAGRLDDELKKRFDIILETVGMMNGMIEAMLVVAQASHVEVSPSECDMRRIFEESWDILKKENRGRKIKFALKRMPKVRADCRLMKQAVFNLLDNAVKFTRNREEALIEAGFEANGEYTFYIQDNGAGFDMGSYDRLFNVFQRLHSPRDYAGIGIGLAIVHRIIVLHGGKVWAKGEVDRGATFYFTLPKQAVPPS